MVITNIEGSTIASLVAECLGYYALMHDLTYVEIIRAQKNLQAYGEANGLCLLGLVRDVLRADFLNGTPVNKDPFRETSNGLDKLR